MDKKYWNNYYKNENTPSTPSPFAEYVLDEWIHHDANGDFKICELGCGNGRDAIFFHEQGLFVNAFDQAEDQISKLNDRFSKFEKINFFCNDFTDLQKSDSYDAIYSRFTLHSINSNEQSKVLKWAFDQVKKGGFLFIEARGLKNGLFKKGKNFMGEPLSFIYDGHYRRFIDLKHILLELNEICFYILYSEEKRGFAPFNDENDFFIRIVVKK
jgi:tellurite methyltransferase